MPGRLGLSIPRVLHFGYKSTARKKLPETIGAMFPGAGNQERCTMREEKVLSSRRLRAFICTMPHYRESTKRELYQLGQNGRTFPLALYQDALYKLVVLTEPESVGLYIQGSYTDNILKYRVSKQKLDAVYAGLFEVQYKEKWFVCDMIGGTDENHVSVVVCDPDNYTGLQSHLNAYMWGGSSVELDHNRINAVRLWLSDDISSQYFD